MGIVSVVIDSREPTWLHGLTFGGALTTVAALDAGDLLIATDDGDLLAVERKTANDFLGSLRDNRIWTQLAGLRSLTPWAYLALCGDLRPGPGGLTFSDGRSTGWNWASVSGALLSIQEAGVHVVWVPSDSEYEQAVIRLANRDRSPIIVQPARQMVLMSEAEQILTSLPGIGLEKARSLLAYCGSPAWALWFLCDEQWDGPNPPKGFGPETKRRVRAALGLKPEQQLWIQIADTNDPVLSAPILEHAR